MKPHKHAELIKAWADGAEIEFFDTRFEDHRWKLCGTPPLWHEDFLYRIKPEPKPDVVLTGHVGIATSSVTLERVAAFIWGEEHNMVFTFDGETGKLKSAEVI